MDTADWAAIARFAPEIGLVAVIGYFSMKALNLFVRALEKRDKELDKSMVRLSKAIEKNTNTSKELHGFMVNLNGKLTRATKNTMKENE